MRELNNREVEAVSGGMMRLLLVLVAISAGGSLALLA